MKSIINQNLKSTNVDNAGMNETQKAQKPRNSSVSEGEANNQWCGHNPHSCGYRYILDFYFTVPIILSPPGVHHVHDMKNMLFHM